jgi:hypothetical protein
MKRSHLLAGSSFVAVLVLLANGPLGQGQPPPQVPPNPQAPILALPVPVGAQRGTALEITLTGSNLAEPTGLWTSFPAKVTIPTDQNNGKDNAKLRVRLEIPKDAPLGFHRIRLATTRGLSNFRLFCIDDLPQIMQAPNNRSRSTPQSVPLPCVVVGRVDAETTDYYKVSVKAGQRISFEVLGRRLGSPFDPQLTLYDARTGRELPGGHSEDAPGLQSDPRLTYTFKEAGDYVVAVHDTLWQGGADFGYRLRIGDFPCATTPLPMAARRGSQATVSFAGPMVEGVASVTVAVPADPTVDTVWVAPRGANGLYGWPVALAVSDHEELLEQEPNNDPTHANRVPVPGGITGRFLEPNDVDHFVFAAKAGQRYAIDAHTHELNSPTEVYLVLKDAKGNQLAASNPMAAPHLDFTAPANGDYTLVVESLIYASGPSETYRITIEPFQPSFDVALGIDRFEMPTGGAVPISLFLTRHDYGGSIDVSVVGGPNFSGQATIAGPPLPPNQPAATLFLAARSGTTVGPHHVVLKGTAIINGKPVSRYANVHFVVSQNLAGLPYPPRDLFTQVGVAVTPAPPFTLALKLDHAEAARGVPVPLTITATRSPGFAEEIVLSPVGLPPTIAPALKNIPKGQNEVKAQLNPVLNAPLGRFRISVSGQAKFQNKEYRLTAPAVELVLEMPFALRFEPAVVQVTPGGKVKLKVLAVRKGGYQGPIAVELQNLPANVSAAKATIGQGQTATDIEITAAHTAAIGNKSNVHLLGTATGAGNQQVASANFNVNVVKK